MTKNEAITENIGTEEKKRPSSPKNRKGIFNKKKMKENLFCYSLVIYPLILFIIFYLIVNFNSMLLAFQKIDGTGKTFAGFSNFKVFFSEIFQKDSLLYYSFRNSFINYAVTLVICMPLYVAFSYLLYKECLLHRAISFIVMLPSIMSGLVVAMVVFNLLGSNGLFNKLCETFGWNDGKWFSLLENKKYALATNIGFTIWISFSMSLIIYPTAMRGIDPAIIESSKIDGISNMFQELRYIILPLIYPTFTTFLITGVAGIFTDMNAVLMFYDKNAPAYVYNMGYYFTRMVMVDANDFNYPVYAAGGLVLTVLAAPVTWLVKYLLEKYGPTTEEAKA